MMQKTVSLEQNDPLVLRTALPREMLTCLGTMHMDDMDNLVMPDPQFFGHKAAALARLKEKEAARGKLEQTFRAMVTVFMEMLSNELDLAVDEHARRFLAASLPPVWLQARPEPPLEELPQHCRLRCVPLSVVFQCLQGFEPDRRVPLRR
jgi:hypothetical protein